MRLEQLDYLVCPLCGSCLRLEASSRRGTEIESGRLICMSGCGAYPIRCGVPQLLPELAKNAPPVHRQRHTHSRFSTQWQIFRYGETTWGMTAEERISVALHELEWEERDLVGKVILDAGCGNGTLSKALAEAGATVVATDLSNSVFRAQQYCTGERVHFSQANLLYPPFKPEVFDAIYACGVLHHTADPRRCFEALIPCLKSEEHSRYFTWLYEKRSLLFNATVEPLMKLTRRSPACLLALACCMAAPWVEMFSRALTTLRLLEQGSRTLRDRVVQLHDLLSPPYVWYHSFEEVQDWAQQAGFQMVKKTMYESDEQAPLEQQRAVTKYLTLCRPGFGILCRGWSREQAVANSSSVNLDSALHG